MGFLTNRLGTTVIMTVMALVWAAALLLPVVGNVSFTWLLISRIVLGAAEGRSFPTAMHAVYKWFGNQQRALPSSVVASGAAVGTGMGSGALEVLLVGPSFSVGSANFTLGSPLVSEISPSAQRGGALAVTNSLQTVAGLVAPLVMGLLVDITANPTAGFRSGLLLTGGLVASLGVLSAALIHPESEALRLGRRPPADASKVESPPVS